MNILIWTAYIALCFLMLQTKGGGKTQKDNWGAYDFSGKKELWEEDQKDIEELSEEDQKRYLSYTASDPPTVVLSGHTYTSYSKHLNATLVEKCIEIRPRHYYNPNTAACRSLYFNWYRHKYPTYESYEACVKSKEDRCDDEANYWYYDRGFKKCMSKESRRCLPGDPVYPSFEECKKDKHENITDLFCYDLETTRCFNVRERRCKTPKRYLTMWDCYMNGSQESWQDYGTTAGEYMNETLVHECKAIKSMIYYNSETKTCVPVIAGGYKSDYKAFRNDRRCKHGEGENRCSNSTSEYYYDNDGQYCRPMSDGGCKPGELVYDFKRECQLDDGAYYHCGERRYEAYYSRKTEDCEYMSDGLCQLGDRAFSTYERCYNRYFVSDTVFTP